MQRHADKLQRAKEEAAIKAMRRLLPNASPSVWVLALEECDWDVEQSTVLINTFTAARASELAEIQEVRPCVPLDHRSTHCSGNSLPPLKTSMAEIC